jgi:hypothetical protein
VFSRQRRGLFHALYSSPFAKWINKKAREQRSGFLFLYERSQNQSLGSASPCSTGLADQLTRKEPAAGDYSPHLGQVQTQINVSIRVKFILIFTMRYL